MANRTFATLRACDVCPFLTLDVSVLSDYSEAMPQTPALAPTTFAALTEGGVIPTEVVFTAVVDLARGGAVLIGCYAADALDASHKIAAKATRRGLDWTGISPATTPCPF